MEDKIDIMSLTKSELKDFFTEIGEKPFRAKQLFSWLHNKCVYDYDEMTNLSKSLRDTLKEKTYISHIKPYNVQRSALDPTAKYLWELEDGNMIESVWMEHKHGNSVCISSQVGCACGCTFCASTIDGVVRDVTAGEMLLQVMRMQELEGKKVSNIVIMGSGEPLLNLENLIKFIHIINDEDGQNISQRNITVSTCGIIPKMYELADEKLQITLAISLHAATHEKREKIMPIEKAYPLDELMKTCDYYFEKTGRRLSFEFALINGVNDNEESVEELTSLLHGKNCHVNLIKYNPIKERDYSNVADTQALAFKNMLEKNGVNVTIRRGLGLDIDGACGQLRRRYTR